MADSEQKLTVATYEQIAEVLSHLALNYTNVASTYYNMFYNPVPQDITLQIYDENGQLQDYIVPNRAKDFNFTKNGEGSPEGVVAAPKGTTYQDTLNGSLYIKKLGDGNTGWEEVGNSEEIKRGQGSPEGFIKGRKGDLYINIDTAGLYIKSTEADVTGWVLVSADTNNLADRDLSNLTPTGDNKFLRRDLANLNSAGQSILDGKYDASNPAGYIDSSELGNATITIRQGGVSKGTFTANQKVNSSINLDAVGDGTIVITQNGVVKGTFTTNQNNSTTVELGGGTWGTITGALSSQTDLNTALSNKVSTSDLVEFIPLKTSYVSGTSGYRIWNDGYCEQWGLCPYVANTSVSLPKTYNSARYNIVLTDRDNNDTGGTAAASAVASVTSSSFTISTTSEADGGIYWRTCGYLASGQY